MDIASVYLHVIRNVVDGVRVRLISLSPRSRVHFAQPSLTPKSSLLRRRTSAPSSSMRKR